MDYNRDEIEFTLTCAESERGPTQDAAVNAFGLSPDEALAIMNMNRGLGGRLRCRPDQFGRFIVYRVERGVKCNRVLELKPKLIPGAALPKKPIDVTGRGL